MILLKFFGLLCGNCCESLAVASLLSQLGDQGFGLSQKFAFGRPNAMLAKLTRLEKRLVAGFTRVAARLHLKEFQEESLQRLSSITQVMLSRLLNQRCAGGRPVADAPVLPGEASAANLPSVFAYTAAKESPPKT